MSTFDWESFLKQESKKAIEQFKKRKKKYEEQWSKDWWFSLPDEALESEWLGFPGASEEQIVAAETRLGTTLPPSYRDFLKVTNGWLDYPSIIELWPIEKIDWFSVENQEWIDIWLDYCPEEASDEEYFNYKYDWWYWTQPIRTKYMQTALQISGDDDSEVVLLNPKIIHNDEWEAWLFSSHHAGINRCRSFQEMLQKIGMPGPWT
ncbi:MAG: SMI1/KNR4 family protein [Okeania sp. SIO3C4]|nr:SMI1/KNR4 family protein [Okeania sp. SIO3B3]NER03014.1 SMI1/KNR4 family protein [Okeania sp. SIO3C4]